MGFANWLVGWLVGWQMNKQTNADDNTNNTGLASIERAAERRKGDGAFC
jgi:hypothetical protein